MTRRGELSYKQTLNYNIYPFVLGTLFLAPPKAAWTSSCSSEVNGIFSGFDGPDGHSFFCCFVCLAFESGPMNLCSLINFIAYNNWLSTEKLLEWNGRPFYDLVNGQRRKSFQSRNGEKKARGRVTFKRATGAESDLDWIGIWIWNDIELMEYIQMWSS